VTVCVATLFRWNYAKAGSPPEFQICAIVASDRMITAGDVKYEPSQLKIAMMTSRTMVLVAGDYAVHSQAIQDTRRVIQGARDQSPENIAKLYGKSIQTIKQRRAEDLYLTPLGMNSDTFIAQQKDMADSFIDRITNQLQSYEGEAVEALVVGSDTKDVHLYLVDSRGISHCMDDVGFAAIGIGGWHARSRFMQAGYTNQSMFAQALAVTFAAKRAADIAPGVGEFTDVYLVMKDNYFPLWENVNKKLHDLYKSASDGITQIVVDSISSLDAYIVTPEAYQSNEQQPKTPVTDSQSNEGAASPTAEAARKDEDGSAKTVDYD